MPTQIFLAAVGTLVVCYFYLYIFCCDGFAAVRHALRMGLVLPRNVLQLTSQKSSFAHAADSTTELVSYLSSG